jgi:hypothetical protein
LAEPDITDFIGGKLAHEFPFPAGRKYFYQLPDKPDQKKKKGSQHLRGWYNEPNIEGK